jgi:integrase
VPLADPDGRPKRLLANSTINATVELLARVLDEAVRRKLLVVNAARAKGLRLKEQRSRGNVLEVDELEDLLAAADEIDQRVTPKVLERGATARALRDEGVAWKAIVACLVGAGLRNTELCRIDVRDIDFAHGDINVADAKTEAGVRRSISARCCAMSCWPGARRSTLRRPRARSSRLGQAAGATGTTSTRA